MHIAFVTTELDPIIPGGAGTLVARLRRALVDVGHRVSVVLAAGDTLPDDLPPDPAVRMAVGDDDAGWDLPFMAVSRAAAEALAELHADDPIDLVEVQDFDGLGFWLLSHRGDLGFAETPITIRFHGPVDLQVEAMGASSEVLDAASVMERECFAMADGVVVPSPGIRALVIDRYAVDPARIRVGPPVIPPPADDRRWSAGGSDFLVIGRLSEVKGSHDMIDASIPVLLGDPDATVTFAGADGWSASAHRPMRSWMTERIPDELAGRIRFLGHIDRAGLTDRILGCRCVVAPSRFESFHLGVHEARGLGAPVIVPDLPAFSGLLAERTGALVYDGTVAGLEGALRRASDPTVLAAVAEGDLPAPGDPLAPYRDPLVPPRHRRSQGGVATAAIARLEEAWLTPRRTSPASLGRRMLARVPPGVYRTGKRLVPNRIKDRLRSATDWGDEADRRKWEDRFAHAVSARAGVSWDSVDSNVSVVIPCYNQGGFVREALLSVFEQTADPAEVVIVDDGSDDGSTERLLADLAIPGVRVIRQDNAGLPAARNAGIAAARGSLVVTLDADDMLAPDYLSSLGAALDADPDAAYAHCWAELVGDTHAIWATRPYNPYQLMLSNSVVGCVLLRKEAWEAVGGYDESMRSGNEDWDLWIRLAAAGFGAVQVREPLFRYRKHGVSMSVETEARYEDALDDRMKRHPDLYRRSHLMAMKQAWYPLLTVLGGSDAEPVDDPDVQHLGYAEAGGITDHLLDRVRGKYVTVLPSGSDVTPDVLGALCRVLEEADDAGVASTSGPTPVTVVRTWSLFDPAGPAEAIVTDLAGTAGERLAAGGHPRPDWQVPDDIRGIPVTRQRPEEAGLIPEWAAG